MFFSPDLSETNPCLLVLRFLGFFNFVSVVDVWNSLKLTLVRWNKGKPVQINFPSKPKLGRQD